MRKLTTALICICQLLSISACNRGLKTSLGSREYDFFPLTTSMGPMPEWVKFNNEIGKHYDKIALFFVGFGESKYKDEAKENARSNAITTAVVAVKALATKQITSAWYQIGSNDFQEMEKAKNKIEAISIKNVDVSYKQKAGAYWRYKSKEIIKNGKIVSWDTPVYEYYERYALDYDIYMSLRNEVIRNLKSENSDNEDNKKLYQEIERKLAKIDENINK